MRNVMRVMHVGITTIGSTDASFTVFPCEFTRRRGAYNANILVPIFLDKSLLLSLFNKYKTQQSSKKWIETVIERVRVIRSTAEKYLPDSWTMFERRMCVLNIFFRKELIQI